LQSLPQSLAELRQSRQVVGELGCDQNAVLDILRNKFRRPNAAMPNGSLSSQSHPRHPLPPPGIPMVGSREK
jgi:hypothetical protein